MTVDGGVGPPRDPHAAEVARLGRLYAALSRINQAIIRSPRRDELFRAVCRALVTEGGFRLAWIGWHDPASERLRPVASWGDDDGYLEQLEVRSDERVEGRGPTGTAFRSEQACVCNDLLAEPAMLPWRAAQARSGLRASAALPIRVAGVVAGTLNVYAGAPQAFQEPEVKLLTEAALDLSFALDNRARDEAHTRAEEDARREQRFADAVIESVPGILYLYDQGGRFLRWNRSFEVTSGYPADEVARMHPLDFFAGADRERVERAIADVFERGESSVEASLVTRSGATIPHYFTGRRLTLDGRPCLVGVGIDISERKRAETALSRSEERYRSTLDGILEGCQLLGFDWRYLYLNAAAALHNRRPNAELLGRTMPEAWTGIEATPIFALLRRCMEERVGRHEETRFDFPDGASGWFDVRCQPVPEGIFVLSIDISERKQAELALRELNESLERKVAERTLSLEAARERAVSADRLKSAFLATMSHELRTPLNSIIGFTGTVLKGLAGPLQPEQVKQLGMVQGSARHLLELINDVLDLSKIEADQLEVRLQPFDLRASIERVTASVRPAAERKGLALRTRLDPDLGQLVSDRRRVEQVLLNLLNNAIKFTDRGEVTLVAEVAGDQVRLQVVDTGIGITPEDLATLFQPFRQLDAGLERQHEGTGLGLVICRRLVGLLGGELLVRSARGAGSSFTVTLPRGGRP